MRRMMSHQVVNHRQRHTADLLHWARRMRRTSAILCACAERVGTKGREHSACGWRGISGPPCAQHDSAPSAVSHLCTLSPFPIQSFPADRRTQTASAMTVRASVTPTSESQSSGRSNSSTWVRRLAMGAGVVALGAAGLYASRNHFSFDDSLLRAGEATSALSLLPALSLLSDMSHSISASNPTTAAFSPEPRSAFGAALEEMSAPSTPSSATLQILDMATTTADLAWRASCAVGQTANSSLKFISSNELDFAERSVLSNVASAGMLGGRVIVKGCSVMCDLLLPKQQYRAVDQRTGRGFVGWYR